MLGNLSGWVEPRTRDTTRTRDVIHARMSAVNTYLRDV
jgi:hypothetical protein